MIEYNLDVQQARYLVDHKIKPQHLSKIQEIIFLRSLEGKTYSQIASEYNYDMEYIKASGSSLWKTLSEAFGEQVRKNNCVNFIRRQVIDISQLPIQEKESSFDIQKDLDTFSLIAPKISSFQGREAEIKQLNEWCFDPNCQFILITGMIGCGKTFLATKIAKLLQDDFDKVIWLSANHDIKAKDLIKFYLRSLEPNLDMPSDINNLLFLFVSFLKKYRCCLILDNLDSIFELKTMVPYYRSSCDQYSSFLRCLINTRHNSQVIATSRINLKQLGYYGKNDNVKSLNLKGLDHETLKSIFQHKIDRDIAPDIWKKVCNYHQNNPELIKILVRNINYLPITNSDIYTKKFPLIEEMDYIFARELRLLDTIGKEVVFWLAFNSDSDLDGLLYCLNHPKNKILKVIDDLKDIYWVTEVNSKYKLSLIYKNYVQRHLVKVAIEV